MTLPRMLLGVLVVFITAALLPSCYTRLTTPKEAFNYLSADGDLITTNPNGEPLRAYAIRAPDYNAVLKQKEAQGLIGPTQFRLAPSTRVRVDVWGHGISVLVNIRPDGKIDLPLIGEVQAAGKTIQALKADISERYKAYYQQPPQVIVNTEVNERQDTVRGGDVRVFNPSGSSGLVNLTGDETLAHVLAKSNGINQRSEWNEIAVIRRGLENGETYLIVSDFEKLLKHADLSQDVKMRNGDIVYVPVEKNTLLQEILASFNVLASFIGNINSITDYVETVEAY